MIRAFLSLFTAVFALSLMIGGAYAVFTTSTTNGPQTFQAGQINLANSNGAWEQSWYANNMAPGDTLTYVVTLTNTGNVPEQVTSASTDVGGSLGPVLTGAVDEPSTWPVLQPGDTEDVRVRVSMDPNADNGYMNQQGTILARFDAQSVAH